MTGSGPSFDDRTDFENAERGFVEALDPCIVTDAAGRVVWDLEAYSYLDGDCPDTVNRACGGRPSCARRRGCSR